MYAVDAPLLVLSVLIVAAAVATAAPGDSAASRGSPAPAPAPTPSAELRTLLDDYLDALHERSPEWVGPVLGDDRYNDRLADHSPDAHRAWIGRARRTLERLEAIDRDALAPADRLDADLLRHALEQTLAAAPLKQWQMPVSTMTGPHTWLPAMGSSFPFTRDRHHDDYVARLRQVPKRIRDTIACMREGLAEGRVPPRVTVEPAAPAAAGIAEEARSRPAESGFFKPLRRLPEDDPRRTEALGLVSGPIAEAYLEFERFVREEYLPRTRETVGISEGIDGRRAYEVAILEHTTLPLTADEVHETGLREVARIRAEMMGVIARSDFPRRGELGGDALFAAFVNYLRTDPRFYHDTPEELLRGYRDIAKRVDAEMPRLFRRLPRLPYGVEQTPPFMAPTAPSAYYHPGSLEAAQPGRFLANTYALDQRPTYDMVALTLHEAVPGHHHQIALAYELEGLHPLRRLFAPNAYIEGWALYAERLGLEMGDRPDGRGLYADPYDDFGRLNFEMWRALRLVVDTGIHAKGWTRERAVEYMLANSALSRQNVEAEVTRYIGWPGQALAYKIGELRIRGLRTEAEQALGAGFDLRAFHDELLGDGALPLPVLEAKMRRWIEGRAARAPAPDDAEPGVSR